MHCVIRCEFIPAVQIHIVTVEANDCHLIAVEPVVGCEYNALAEPIYIVRVVVMNMVCAVRKIEIVETHDIRKYDLVPF